MAKSDEFGRLLGGAINSIAYYEGKLIPAIEEEFAQLLHLSRFSVQRYKRGHIPPETEWTKTLAQQCLKRAMLDRRWAVRFLRSAQYPGAKALVSELEAERG